MSEYATRDDILGAKEVRFCDFGPLPDDFPIPGLAGKKIRLKSMTAKENVAYEEFFVDAVTGKEDENRKKLYREKAIIDCVVDGDGSRMFTIDDIRKLSKVDGALLGAIYDRASKHNRFDEADLVKKKPEPTPDFSSS